MTRNPDDLLVGYLTSLPASLLSWEVLKKNYIKGTMRKVTNPQRKIQCRFETIYDDTLKAAKCVRRNV